MDLEAMGLQEMNRSEMTEVEGGIIPLIIAAVAVAVVASSCASVKYTTDKEEADKMWDGK
ncbi:MAG: class IIb bacteriocin, lactobin A/cerein 7B family [Prevotellaceae bacterium]|nr:class IIb bacteriocin, lactobin A/cerein 7B family [Prevotellaceae bacterium]